jgi:hypothetical protein
MVQIDDKIISLDIFERKFVCDLPACKGDCCVEGESGAPLSDEETLILEKIYGDVKPFLTATAIDEIAKQGTWVVDGDGDKVTPIINGRECVYAYYDEDKICKCAIEKAYQLGLIAFKKPISCHLYPIRISQYKDFEALNYHHWPICQPARVLGKKVGVPVYQFLREPIVRKYGEEFYKTMEEIDIELRASGMI